jgi:hypothetical protein
VLASLLHKVTGFVPIVELGSFVQSQAGIYLVLEVNIMLYVGTACHISWVGGGLSYSN